MQMRNYIMPKMRKRKPTYKLPSLRCVLSEPLVGFEPTTPRLQITCSGQLSYIGRWVSYLHRAATTGYPCCGQTLGDSEGACRVGLTRVQK